MGVYRNDQEALANVEKHAGARHVQVELVVTPDALQLVVEDDGRGFQAQAIPEGHYGLIGINERVHLMGGKLDIHSSRDAGTHVKVLIPLEQ